MQVDAVIPKPRASFVTNPTDAKLVSSTCTLDPEAIASNQSVNFSLSYIKSFSYSVRAGELNL